MKDLARTLQAFYLNYVNNSRALGDLTLEHDLSYHDVLTLLGIGKRVHEDRARLAQVTNNIRKAAHQQKAN